MAEWSARWTSNPAVPGSSPALATCWICSRDKSSSTFVKSQLVASCQLGFLIKGGFELFVSTYQSRAPVNELDKLTTFSTMINKPLNLFLKPL